MSALKQFSSGKMTDMTNKSLIDKLNTKKELEKGEWLSLISTYTDEDRAYAAALARKITDDIFGKNIYLRGLIEISNICKNDCLYCGIRKSNACVLRYRMTKEEILECAENGYQAGFRTLVLQGGEDGFFSDEVLIDIISEIRTLCPDAAITLSLGERTYDSYKRLFSAGADRYLLRHETATDSHYSLLHPENLTLKNRLECLYNLKEIGFQTGCGMMIGAPGQTPEHLAEDMLFMRAFRPHMIGIGPFLPAKNTPFEKEKSGTLSDTLFFLSLCRIMLPDVLLPATTALGTIDEKGREKGIFAGANVIMPNISPTENRKNYSLYDNKIGTADTARDSKEKVEKMLVDIGFSAPSVRGDFKKRGDFND